MMQTDPAPPIFRDRAHAGELLAPVVAPLARPPVVVLGLARGGVPVAVEVARLLGVPVDALVVKKIGHPLQPEYALGATVAGGPAYLQEPTGLAPEELERIVARADAAARALEARLHGEGGPPDPSGATCVLVDDGLATGSTMVASILWARARGATRVVAAVPVASVEGAARVREEADALACPFVVRRFWSVSTWYARFGQVDDDEVLTALAAAAHTG